MALVCNLISIIVYRSALPTFFQKGNALGCLHIDTGSWSALHYYIFCQLFDRKFVDAVLQEWYKSMVNLPAGLRQAYEMVSTYLYQPFEGRLFHNMLHIWTLQGLVSSAQMVRFLAINARPTAARAVSRTLPDWLSRAFIGR